MSSTARRLNLPVIGSLGRGSDIVQDHHTSVHGRSTSQSGETSVTHGRSTDLVFGSTCGQQSTLQQNKMNQISHNSVVQEGDQSLASDARPLLQTPTSSSGGNGGGGGGGSLISNLSFVATPSSYLTKDAALATSKESHWVRHRVGFGNQIHQHLLRAAELRKISKGGLRPNAVKRWFVLYDDSHNPIGGGGGPGGNSASAGGTAGTWDSIFSFIY